ncbi:MAG: hypothetical protein HYU67_02200 [Flavobacteriia bacterium]|nr:hypothetical protein [Flavobacteriia bacterium]
MFYKLNIYFIILTFLLNSCRKEATIWNSNWTAPLISDTLSLKNWVNDSTLSVVNGNYQLALKRNLFRFKPSELLKIPDTNILKSYAISISNITVAPGTSFVNDNKDHFFNMKDALMKNARIKSGLIFVEVTNPLSTAIDINIELTKVQINGVKLNKSTRVPAKSGNNPGVSTITVDLSGYWIDLSGSDGYQSNALSSKITALTDPNGTSVTLSSLDSTRFNLQFKDLQFDYARGYFGKHIFSDTFIFISKWLKDNIKGTINLPEITTQFVIKNNIKDLSKVNIAKVSNTNNDLPYTTYLSNSQLGTPFYIELPTGSWSTLQTTEKIVELNPLNSNIENFIENLGDQTEIHYDLEINPNGNITGNWDEFFPQSELSVDWLLNMPLAVGLNEFIITDTFALNLTQNEDNTHVESAQLIIETENAFPLEGDLNILFLDENKQELYQDKTKHTILSSKNGHFTTLGIPSNFSNFTYSIPKEIVEEIEKIKYITIELNLNSQSSTPSQTLVEIPENAFFAVRIKSKINLQNVLD